jgi:NhaA family Na+:H+ antiporter
LEDIWHGDSNEETAGDDPLKFDRLRLALRETSSPLQRLDAVLHPWVAFVIMPVFALANAGVPLELQALVHPVSLAVSAGLVIGKPVGILTACALAVWLKVAVLPSGVTWPMLFGSACLAGIGFTMALFLNALSFADAQMAANAIAGKTGTILGSLVSAVIGTGLLIIALREPAAASD